MLRAKQGVLVVTATALAAAALAASGCGGSNSTSSTDTNRSGEISRSTAGESSSQDSTSGGSNVTVGVADKPLTPAELAAKGNSICRQLATTIASTIEARPSKGKDRSVDRSEIVQIARQRKAAEQIALAKLGGLSAPASLSADWRGFLALKHSANATLAKLSEVSQSHEIPAEQPLMSELSSIQTKLVATTGRLRLNACAEIK